MRPVSSARLAHALVGLGLVLLAAAAWLARPRPAPPPPRPALRAVLLDASAGSTRRRPGWAGWARRVLADEARAAREAGQELFVVRYAADVEVLFGPGPPVRFEERLRGRAGEPLVLRPTPASEAGTRLAEALGLAAREVRAAARGPGALVVLGERSFTGPDPAPMLSGLVAAGIEPHFVDPPLPELPNLALRELLLPVAPADGEPLAARATFELEAGAEALPELVARAELELELELVTRGVRRVERRPLGPPPLAPGARGARWSVALDLGPAEAGWVELALRARLRASGALRAGDPIPEDDARRAVTRVGGARLALCVAPPARHAELQGWLLAAPWPGIAWRVLEPTRLADELGRADLVFSLDVSLAELPARELATFVERDGGGWLACGGWGLLRHWTLEPGGPELARFLPLLPARDEGEPREALFLVDGSGSMVGEPFERVRRALVEMAEVAPPRDRLAMRFFTGVLHARQELSGETPAVRRRALERLLGLRPPGGETAILYSLERLVEELARDARPGRVILLSDGRDLRAFDVAARAASIRAALAAAGRSLVVVACGPQADLDLLRELAGEATALHDAGDLSGLAELFQLEVNRERVREGPFEPLATPAAALRSGPARELADAFARLGSGGLPAVERYARAEAAPGADVLLRAGPDEPLLAVARVGAGLVAAWSSGPLDGWAPAWRGARGTLAALVHTLAAEPRERAPRAALGGGRLEIDGLPSDLPPSLQARLEDAAGRALATLRLDPPRALPGEDPRTRRGASLAALPSPSAAVRVVILTQGEEFARLPMASLPAEEWGSERPLGPLPDAAPVPSAGGLPAAPDRRHVPLLGAALVALFLSGLGTTRRGRAA